MTAKAIASVVVCPLVCPDLGLGFVPHHDDPVHLRCSACHAYTTKSKGAVGNLQQHWKRCKESTHKEIRFFETDVGDFGGTIVMGPKTEADIARLAKEAHGRTQRATVLERLCSPLNATTQILSATYLDEAGEAQYLEEKARLLHDPGVASAKPIATAPLRRLPERAWGAPPTGQATTQRSLARAAWMCFPTAASYSTHRIRMVSPDGTVSTLTGTTQGFVDGPRATAKLNSPFNVAVMPNGSLIVSEWSQRIRLVAPDGLRTLLAFVLSLLP